MKIALLGNLAGVSNEVLLGLRREGIDARLFITSSDISNTFGNDNLQIDPAWVSLLDPFPSLARIPSFLRSVVRDISAKPFDLLKFDLLHSHTAALNFSIGAFGLYSEMRLRPYLAFATGSDFREMKSTLGINGYMLEKHFRRAKRVLLLNTDMLALRNKLDLPRAEFFPFVINEQEYSPEYVARPSWLNGKFLCFMMSNLDFGIADNKLGRNSMKHNDRFLHAIAEYRKENQNIHAIVIDRGPDRELAKNLVADLGIANNVTFMSELSRAERIRYIRMSDVVVDQFHVGAFGLGALEALAVGKPLITYLKLEGLDECYSDPPPILNAQSSADIVSQLRGVQSLVFRHDLSQRARDWLLRHHSRDVVIQRLINLYRISI
jgi:glycosyltransferase involved in cell wall biosynthesis